MRRHQLWETVDWRYLSPIDTFIPQQYIRQILCFPGKGPSAISAFKHGLERCISSIPCLSSSIVPCSKPTHQPQDDSSHPFDKYAKFRLGTPVYDIKGILSVGTSQLLEGTDYGSLKRASFPNNLLNRDVLLPPLPHFPVTNGSAPAFRVHVTPRSDGTIVGVCLHHSVADLGGINAIFKTWAYFCKKHYDEDRQQTFGSDAVLPVENSVSVECDRHIVYGSRFSEGSEFADKYTAEEPSCPADITVLNSAPPTLTSDIISNLPMETVHYRIPRQTVHGLKVTLSEYLQPGTKLSSNDVICAMLWSAITFALAPQSSYSRARGRDHPASTDEVVSMGLSIDMRKRLHVPIPEDFVGNALSMAWPTVPKRLLLDAAQGASSSSSSLASMAHIAVCIQESYASLTEDYFHNLIAYLGSHEDVNKLQWGPGPASTNMVAATWKAFEIHSLDWGGDIGKCEAVRTRLPFPHTITILPEAPDSEGTDIVFCFLNDTMQIIKSCEIIQQYYQRMDVED
ncbi:transferase family-domain-containing protein [Truncatella angustata]|uniref:Transferase family-domain-containing protein n=1 Tax=Truncatella angustata TaxID=152316 RepID=A0A9P8RPG7_9PEZI|nr:transferase family-domain-containing protein [Truncatella angustata]KAH6647940.1 transferase family-domain-containing protein [Truncatella angustata]KAH8203676.1 hypothetical protein TruAng_002206 [Truncatella angustata]